MCSKAVAMITDRHDNQYAASLQPWEDILKGKILANYPVPCQILAINGKSFICALCAFYDGFC